MKDDGGPAFPVSYEVNPDGHQSGMRLRDWFAGNANEEDIQEMQLAHRRPIDGTDQGDGYGPEYTSPSRQEARYLHADAMLAARKDNQ